MSDTEYKGEPIDASWSTAPWNREGETVEASDDDAEEHDMKTIEWPDGATPKEELTDAQIAVIKKAARYRNIDSSRKLTKLAVGDERSPSHAGNVIKRHWPDRYWVDPEESTDDIYLESLERENPIESKGPDHTGEKHPNSSLTKEDVKEIRVRIRGGESITEVADSFPVSRTCVSEAAKGISWDHIESPPPVEYDNTNGEYVPKGLADDPADWKGQQIESITTEKLRERALNGETAKEIAMTTPASDRTVRAHLKGERTAGDPDIPPLGYDKDKHSWVVKNEADDETTEQSKIGEEPESEQAQKQWTTEYEPPTMDRDDDRSTDAKTYLAVAAVAYTIYRLIRRIV